ncbi:uncharacterized protein K444DRAFT_651234 [Hyaloscypha bicolor E]|uniref:Uncharacterized protein n=1 Tax=Hyaloscypha bicolor E TaxID=1095630 RepID=A0A2J6TL43_9HELO|nr:uncharacterized protein K444DRAFT_651234 [Hyaloscypha bicolor E]PMD63726.1 hypothetical protein K444DRAFT_651234 [Hyaloscypha bicolor E]
MPLGKITNALFSGSNENTLQLASLNVDISLLKFEAPREFKGLGSALSLRRRADAEDGPLHQTARKLGALFEPIIPSYPKLVKAYGMRASAIFESPGVNPKGSRKDGAFETFVGADGTSLWAAATSGHASIAVHLLACMLARSWEAKSATAIWVELILERKRELHSAVESGSVTSMTLIMTLGEDIPREQIRLWDASARSWLQSADQEKISEQKRLDLILKNISLLVSGGATTYESVTSAWIQAMEGLEKLLSGTPQQICDGSILLALSAWHIFPNLLVLGPKTVNVAFNDPLVPKAGVVTIGLQNSERNQGEGIGWSLALSHLRYYGDPVPVANEDIKGRVAIRELHLVALGALLRQWSMGIEDAPLVCRWLTSFWQLLSSAPRNQPIGSSDVNVILELNDEFCWLEVLVLAADRIVHSNGEELDTAMMLVSYGLRRGETFLGRYNQKCRTRRIPFYGLCNHVMLSSLAQESVVDCGIQYFRGVAQNLGLEDCDAIISYTHRDTIPFYEFASAVPHQAHSHAHCKRLISGELKQKQVHSRSFNHFRNARKWSCSCKTDFAELGCTNFGFGLLERVEVIASRGEYSAMTGHGLQKPVKGSDGFPRHDQEKNWAISMTWEDPPLLYSGLQRSGELYCASESRTTSVSHPCSCFDRCSLYVDHYLYQWATNQTKHRISDWEIASEQTKHIATKFDLIAGDYGPGQHALWLRRKETLDGRPSCDSIGGIEIKDDSNNSEQSEGLVEGLSLLNPVRVAQFLAAITDTDCQPSSAIFLLAHPHLLPKSQWRALDALGIASRLYDTIPGATVPLTIVFMDLSTARWHMPQESKCPDDPDDRSDESSLPESTNFDRLLYSELSRPQVFACLLMFETGSANIDVCSLSSVVAMSSGNSIYVASRLLSDPANLVSACHIKRIVGNIGMPGISMMVAPQNPRLRELTDDWRQVRHAKYDSKREDNFKGTTLHFSFTDWKLPLEPNSSGTVDKDIFLIESIVSVHDSGEWVADLNLLRFMPSEHHILDCICKNEGSQATTREVNHLVSIDNWDELIDGPHDVGIFRARGNWAARLAASSILSRKCQEKGEMFYICSSLPCLKCARRLSGKVKILID